MPKLVNPRYDIDVTQERIDAGERHSACSCPVALAVADALGITPEMGCIDVDAEGIYLASDGIGSLRRASGPLPRAVRRFVRRFDAGLPVEPTKFRIAIRDI